VTRVRMPCKRCKGEGTVESVRKLSPREMLDNVDGVDREIVFTECGVCLGTGFDESAEALSGDG